MPAASSPADRLPAARLAGRWWSGVVGAVSRVDTALSAVRTVLTLRLAPVLLLVFAVVWPIAGFPWWPLVFVLALGVALRILGFGYLLAGKRGPVLLVALLVVTTLFAWTPWAAVTALGGALAIAGGVPATALAAARARDGAVPGRRLRLGRRDRDHRPAAGGQLGPDGPSVRNVSPAATWRASRR